ncbi:MAG: hypothetical protein HY320_08615, partial [Armatimonadetes bacterium]|nr:hypothetical protein [Armatimonadota bacterium]
MIAAEDALGATVAGGPPVGTGARGKRCAIATEHQSLEVTQEAPLDRWEDATGAEEVFQPCEQLLGPGLIGSREQLLGQAFGHGIGLRGIPSLRGVPGRLFLLEVAPIEALALAAGTDAVRAWGRIGAVFEAVDTGIERPDRRGLE